MSDITNRLRELAHAVADQRWSEFSMRVPADHGRDADLVLMRAADEITQLRAKLDTMTAERNGLRIALNEARSALKLWARWNDMTEAELALALEATTTALAKAGVK